MSTREADKNRWLIAVAAVAIHLSIGSIYAYSIYQIPLNETQGWSTSSVTLAFSIAVFVLGITAAFLGRYVEEYGPRKSGLAAATLYGLGMVGSGVSVQLGSLPLFLATFGVVGGMGIGLGYISPIGTLVEWFPDRRGMATGLAVMGFGAGALLTGPLGNYLIQRVGVATAFYALGVLYFALMSLGASYLAKPPQGWLPEGMEGEENAQEKAKSALSGLENLTAAEARTSPRFWMVWLIIFINVSAGIMLLAFASPMLQQIAGATATTAAFITGYIGIFNGGGRIFWSTLSDYIGRTTTYGAFFAIQIVAFFVMPELVGVWVLSATMFLVITCYGGGFACLPAYLSDLFGTQEVSAIHGYALTAWGVAGVVGPQLASYVLETTGNYTTALYVMNGALVVGLITVAVLRWRIGNLKERSRQAGATPTD
ncbi:L-lactate MFS transporter [Candidatus Halobonum tyrrellensis]|uniref:Major facilitator family oxalate/formate antiporter n=1 Tax=Candidatus Halobonum tyrrellensis G22 TaxID=1324957 RepID=V4J024_9EURY|nr:OFA family MFS transporter [Candidatus Halobonum tyrrellensis]ESP88782.1 major facilitator family oxalate/formate antiporter [Candidatus Halobonum tyrrellensis G22]